MSKNETYFVRFIILVILYAPLNANQWVGILSAIESNAKQTLLYQNNSIGCTPLGIVPLEIMVKNGASPEECRKRIDEFFRTHPHEKVFAKEFLHLQQSYHFEMFSEGCILYANGLESFSELLLRRGLARIAPRFDNPEWNAKFKNAQNSAQRDRRGLYDTLILKYCIQEEK